MRLESDIESPKCWS